jgi:E1A/CREB-binding protein
MNVGQAAHLSGQMNGQMAGQMNGQMAGQGAQMNQVGGGGGGGGNGVIGADGMPQHQQMQDAGGLGPGIDPQFVLMRNQMREKM